MLRTIIRALAAWASIAVLALLAHVASADTFHSLIEENFSDPSTVPDRWQVMAGNWSAAHGTYGSTVSAPSITTIGQSSDRARAASYSAVASYVGGGFE